MLVPKHEEPKLDQVKAVQEYMIRTSYQDNVVFVSLNFPHTALNASTISNVLEEASELAGLKGRDSQQNHSDAQVQRKPLRQAKT